MWVAKPILSFAWISFFCFTILVDNTGGGETSFHMRTIELISQNIKTTKTMISSLNNSWNYDLTSVKITKSLFTAYLPTKEISTITLIYKRKLLWGKHVNWYDFFNTNFVALSCLFFFIFVLLSHILFLLKYIHS